MTDGREMQISPITVVKINMNIKVVYPEEFQQGAADRDKYKLFDVPLHPAYKIPLVSNDVEPQVSNY